MKRLRAIQANVYEVDKIINEVSWISLYMVAFKINLINNYKYWWVDTNTENMYKLRRRYSPLPKKWMVNIHEGFIIL